MTPERLKGLISDAKQQTVEQVKAFPLTALAHIQGLASVLEALLVDTSILRDDQKSAEATIAELKDNCRCPECGCATIADAESNECGCDAPVCLIEAGDTLAKAYVREFELAKKLLQKNDAASDTIATLKGEVERLKAVELDYNSYLVESCKSIGADHIVDWDGVNPRLALAARYALKQIDLHSKFDALVEAAEKVLLRHDGTFYTESINSAGDVDVLRTAVAAAKDHAEKERVGGYTRET